MNSQQQDLIDLKQVFVNVTGKWKVVCATGCALSLIAGLYSTYIVKPVFVSHAQLVATKGAGDAQGAAAVFLGAKTSGNDAELFQRLLKSRKAAKQLLNEVCLDSSGTMKRAISSYYLKDSSSEVNVDEVIDAVVQSVSIEVETTDGASVVSFSYSAESPWLAKTGGDLLIKNALEFYREVKILKYEAVSSRLGKAVDETYREWKTAASRIADYRERNRSITMPDQQLSLEALVIDKSAKEQKYLMARKELEDVNLNVLKISEPMVIIDSLEIPRKKTKPNRRLYVLGGLMLGVALTSCYYCIRLGDQKHDG